MRLTRRTKGLLLALGCLSHVAQAWTTCGYDAFPKTDQTQLSATVQSHEDSSKTDNNEETTKLDPYGRNLIKHKPFQHGSMLRGPGKKVRVRNRQKARQKVLVADPKSFEHDRAMLILHYTLGMTLVAARDLLKEYPALYTDCRTLATGILYLRHEAEVPEKKLIRMFEKLPSLMVTLLLNNPEQSLNSSKLALPSRERAIRALMEELHMHKKVATTFVDESPELYTDCPSLRVRLLYFLKELCIPSEKLSAMLSAHPKMTIHMLLNDPEQNIKTPVELLQTEAEMTLEEMVAGKFCRVQRSELRCRIQTLRAYMSSHDLKKMVSREPELLGGKKEKVTRTGHRQADPHDMRRIYVMMEAKLGATDDNIRKMTENYPGLFLTSPDRVARQLDFLLNGPVAEGLGLVIRRGITSRNAETEEEVREIERIRTLDLIVSLPVIGLTKNLIPICHYLQSIGCSSYDLGRILYRRPQLFQFEVESLSYKVDYYCTQLDTHDENNNITRTVVDMMATMPDVFTLSIQPNIEEKFKFLRELGFNTTGLRTVFSNRPQILCLNLEKNIRPKLEYLLSPISEGGAGLSREDLHQLVIGNPQGMRESLDMRIKPRCQVCVEKGIKIPWEVPYNLLTMKQAKFDTMFIEGR